jgi:hypothetical protein
MTESFIICNSRSRRPVRKLLDTLSYLKVIQEDRARKTVKSCSEQEQEAQEHADRGFEVSNLHVGGKEGEE